MSKCCAPNCLNVQKKNSSEYSFFVFPDDSTLRRKWISNIGRINWTPGRRSVICSVHFDNSQLQKTGDSVHLLRDAIPTLFHPSKRKRISQTHKISKLKVSKGCANDEAAERKIEESKSFKGKFLSDSTHLNDRTGTLECREEIKTDLNQSQANHESELQVKLASGGFMDDFVFVDSSYIPEDCEVVRSELEPQESHLSCQSADEEECILKSTSNIKLQNISSSLVESTLIFERKDQLTGVVDVENDGVSVGCSKKIPLSPDQSQSVCNDVILIQQPLQDSIVCKQVLNLASIATPYPDNAVFPFLEDISESQNGAQTIEVPPLKRRRLSHRGTGIPAVKMCDEDSVKLKEDSLSVSSESIKFMEKGFVDLPVSIQDHLVGKNSRKHDNSAVKWQTGTFMCRLCGVASNQTINLFSAEATEIRLRERVSSILSIKIVESDDLPQCVCSKCLSCLDSCSELIVTSFSTQQQLASVMGQDVKQSSQLSVYFHDIEKKGCNNLNGKRQILLMEICIEEGKPVEEYLSVAYNDLYLHLDPKSGPGREPQCSLVLASINDSCSISQVEQARTAAEALIFKDLINRNRFEIDPPPDSGEFLSDDSRFNMDEHDSGLAVEPERYVVGTEKVSDATTNSYDVKLIEPSENFELSSSEVQVMPITDDCSPHIFYPTDIRCPKLSQSWKKRKTDFRNIQNLVFWKVSESGDIKLNCRLCKSSLNQKSIKDHLEEHLSKQKNHQENVDDSFNTCLPFRNTQRDRNTHECTSKSPTRTPQPTKFVDEESCDFSTKREGCPLYLCSSCNAYFLSRPSLKAHFQQQHHAANAICEGCGHENLDVSDAIIHRQICKKVRKEKEWRCRKCLESFMKENDLKKHQALTGHDNEATTWLCDICGKRYNQAAKLNQHRKIHLPPEFKYIHQCPHCPKRYINSSRLKEHMQKHDEKKFMCKVCGKLFSTKQILRQHEFTHGDPQFMCSLCSRTFFRKSHLLKHMNVHNPLNLRASRTGPQPHRDGLNRCRECKEVFDQKELLNHYKICHSHISLQNYICDICKEENTSYAELFQHQREIHKTGVKDCPFCNKTIDSSTQMKYHLMKHEGMFPYNCPLCGHGYAANSVLQDHIRRKHTGEKPFECQQCSKCFPTSGALAQHNTVHSLPHQLLPCPVCNQGFKRKAHLDVHLRTHTGEKPYPCPICDRPFRQRPDCVKHIRVIHGEDPTKFEIRFHPNMCITFPQVVSVADMELVLEGEDLMQTSLEATQLLVSQ